MSCTTTCVLNSWSSAHARERSAGRQRRGGKHRSGGSSTAAARPAFGLAPSVWHSIFYRLVPSSPVFSRRLPSSPVFPVFNFYGITLLCIAELWFKNFEGQCAAVTVNGSAADGVVEHVDFACPPAGRDIGNRAPGVHVANGDAKRVTVR